MVSTPKTLHAHDYTGNTVSKTDSGGTTNYTWDYENGLTSVTLPGTGGTVTFKYDPFGRRIYKSSSSGTSINAYDGNDLANRHRAGSPHEPFQTTCFNTPYFLGLRRCVLYDLQTLNPEPFDTPLVPSWLGD